MEKRYMSVAGKWVLRCIHWGIIINFVVEIVYAGHMIFNVIAPPGGGPLFDQAKDFPFEMMVTRRLYATEFWIAFSGLAIYLAITEVGPRLARLHNGESGD